MRLWWLSRDAAVRLRTWFALADKFTFGAFVQAHLKPPMNELVKKVGEAKSQVAALREEAIDNLAAGAAEAEDLIRKVCTLAHEHPGILGDLAALQCVSFVVVVTVVECFCRRVLN